MCNTSIASQLGSNVYIKVPTIYQTLFAGQVWKHILDLDRDVKSVGENLREMEICWTEIVMV